ncbi:MAG TPA: hypothetical protein VHV10_04320, partial [Ktedonobacteraceae bacterium]|nr:hypothetical protein [Ktedonobacteraceae bacterium]
YGSIHRTGVPLGSLCARWITRTNSLQRRPFHFLRGTTSTLANLFGLSAGMQQEATRTRPENNLEGGIRGTRWAGIGHNVCE